MNTCPRCGGPVPGFNEPTNDFFHTHGGLCLACYVKDGLCPSQSEQRQAAVADTHLRAQRREVAFRLGEVGRAVRALEKAVAAT